MNAAEQLHRELQRLRALRDAASRGPWRVRSAPGLQPFVEAPRAEGMAYALEVLGEDYTGYGEDAQRAADVAFVASIHQLHELLTEYDRLLAPLRQPTAKVPGGSQDLGDGNSRRPILPASGQ